MLRVSIVPFAMIIDLGDEITIAVGLPVELLGMVVEDLEPVRQTIGQAFVLAQRLNSSQRTGLAP